MRKLRSLAFSLCLGSLCLGGALAAPAVAHAGDPVSPSSEPLGKEEAIKAFTKGRDLILAGKQAEALPVLTRSFQLLPSPNTELLIAHAEKGLGRKARAAGHYDHVVVTAQAEIAKGNTKYEETIAEAKRALLELGPSLGVIEITAGPMVKGTVTRSADDVASFAGSARIFAEPGRVTIKPAGGPEQSVEIAAGQTQKVDLSAIAQTEKPPPPPIEKPAPEEKGSGIGGLGIAGIVIGGVGLVGVGVFAGMGSSAQSTYDELVACGCSVEDAEVLREDGKQAQLVANVSLGVGLGLVAGGVTMLIVDLVSPKTSDEAAPVARLAPMVAIDKSGGFAGVSVLLP
jgi:hypothetical protein